MCKTVCNAFISGNDGFIKDRKKESALFFKDKQKLSISSFIKRVIFFLLCKTGRAGFGVGGEF